MSVLRMISGSSITPIQRSTPFSIPSFFRIPIQA